VSSGQSLFTAFIIMFVCIVFGVFINFSFASMFDMISNELAIAGVHDVSPAWDTSSSADFMGGTIRLLGYAVPIMGVVNFLYSAVRRQRYDYYQEAP